MKANKTQMQTDRSYKHNSAHVNHASAIIFRTAIAEKWLSIGIFLTVVGAVGISLIPPLILGKIIDRIASGNQIGFSFIAIYFLFLVMTGVLESLREGFLTVFGQKITHAFRSELSEKVYHLEADTLMGMEPGNVVSRFVGDVNTVEMLFTSGIISMFADACRIISIFAVIWSKNQGLAWVLIVLFPFLYGFTRRVQGKMLTAQLANRVAVGRVTNHVPETIRCIRTIHTLQKEPYMEQKYDNYIGESYASIEKTNFYDAIYSPVILFLNACIVAFVMILAGSGNAKVLSFFGMSVGTSVAVINYISQVFSPIESLGMEIQTIQSALAGVRRIDEFLKQKERTIIKDSTNKNTNKITNKLTNRSENNNQNTTQININAQNQSENDSVIEFENVTFSYDSHTPVLDGLSFSVTSGEHVTLTGRTGAGKSTIFKLLLGLYRPQDGMVKILGKPAFEISDDERRKIFGYVEQSFHMIPGTVRDQITLSDQSITKDQIQNAIHISGLDEAIGQLEHGLDTICTPEIFSQGQWQLLSIARAVVAEPKILLLDEITANMDAETENMVLDALGNASNGRTVMSISHRLYRKSEGQEARQIPIFTKNKKENIIH